jgi:hypothetical protein
MSGHIPLRRRNYTPYTPISSKISPIGADCLHLSGVLLEIGVVGSSEPTDSSRKITGYQGCSESNDIPTPGGYIPPAREAGSVIKAGKKNFLLKSLGSLF